MGGINAQDLHLAGEEPELLQRQSHRALIRVPLNIGVELGDREAAVQDIAL
jgi:hypothetical protein